MKDDCPRINRSPANLLSGSQIFLMPRPLDLQEAKPPYEHISNLEIERNSPWSN